LSLTFNTIIELKKIIGKIFFTGYLNQIDCTTLDSVRVNSTLVFKLYNELDLNLYDVLGFNHNKPPIYDTLAFKLNLYDVLGFNHLYPRLCTNPIDCVNTKLIGYNNPSIYDDLAFYSTFIYDVFDLNLIYDHSKLVDNAFIYDVFGFNLLYDARAFIYDVLDLNFIYDHSKLVHNAFNLYQAKNNVHAHSLIFCSRYNA
jgi:hypothetical protein